MFLEFAMSFRGLVQGKRAGYMHFKRAGLDQAIEFFDLFWIRLNIIAFDFYARTRSWSGRNAIGISHASVFAHGTQGEICGLTSCGNECGIQTARRESTRS